MPEVSALRSWLFGVVRWMGLPRPPPPPPKPPCDELDRSICAAAAALTGCFDLLREECWKCGWACGGRPLLSSVSPPWLLLSSVASESTPWSVTGSGVIPDCRRDSRYAPILAPFGIVP